jgi:hypothetical protein
MASNGPPRRRIFGALFGVARVGRVGGRVRKARERTPGEAEAAPPTAAAAAE